MVIRHKRFDYRMPLVRCSAQYGGRLQAQPINPFGSGEKELIRVRAAEFEIREALDRGMDSSEVAGVGR